MKNMHFAAALGFSILTMTGSAALAVDVEMDDAVIIEDSASIAKEDVKAAQIAWGEALVRISSDFAEGGIDLARATAEEVLDTAYGFQMGPVLFNPTLTEAPQSFRTTREGALAYFIGHDENFPRDTGFALGGWTDVEIENYAVFIQGDIAKTMGNVHLTNADGDVVTVYKTWGFVRDEAGDLRIVLHHSSLPFVSDAS
ncbi:MAG: phosphoribosyl-AMP cyclohydrolase [Roseinatronobacter sp.]